MNKKFSPSILTSRQKKIYGYGREYHYKLLKNDIRLSVSLREQMVSQLDSCFVFEVPDNIYDMIERFRLRLILKNKRTTIYENDNARFSVDKKVIRVLLFDKQNNN